MPIVLRPLGASSNHAASAGSGVKRPAIRSCRTSSATIDARRPLFAAWLYWQRGEWAVTTTAAVDLSCVGSAREIHAAFSNALGFPEWYGHNWDAFWDLVSSEYPLPDRLTIRGLDHVERLLPNEATKLLTCLGDYNNDTGRLCKVRVTEDYAIPLFFLQYEATPTSSADHGDAKGAFVSCWIKAPSSQEANRIAWKRIQELGWEIVSHEEIAPASLANASDDDRRFVEQACVDGTVFNFHSWSSEE